jgi:membrane-bound lytic murein transglycosylase B
MVGGTLTGDETVSVMAIAHRTLLRLICAAAVTAALAGSASAQFPAPSFSLQHDKQKTPQEIEHDKAIDQAYQSATKKIPDKSTANDPWADVRPAPPAVPPKKKQQVSQEKKHAE